MVAARFSEVVDAITTQIVSGDLPAGSRLPTQRELADQFGVAPATANRVYQELRRKGLAVGEVGRGTFVRGPSQPTAEDLHGPVHPDRIDFGMNAPILIGQDELFRTTMLDIMDADAWAHALRYQPPGGREADRAAAAKWFAARGVSADPRQILVTSGAQHALYIAITLFCRPGDTVAVEEHTYPGFKILADQHHLKFASIRMDEEGIVPDSLEEACRLQGVRALYCMPTIHNPRGTLMKQQRREKIAGICVHHGVSIIEDDAYSFLDESGFAPLRQLSPENCINIQSMSKAFAPGLRTGFIVMPNRYVSSAERLIRSTTWTANAMMSGIVARLIGSGEMEDLVRRKRADATARQTIARTLLPLADMQSHPSSYHVWIRLPNGLRSDDLTRHLDKRGIAVSSGSAFTTCDRDVSAGIRLALGSSAMGQLAHGLTVVAEALETLSRPISETPEMRGGSRPQLGFA